MKNKLLKLFTLTLTLCVVMLTFTACQKPHVHNYDKQVATEEYIASAAACEQKATYYLSCDCSEKGTETFEFGDALEHSFTNYVSDNNAKCETDGTETAICDRANCIEEHTRTKVGSALEHSYTNYVSNNDAKCETDGTETAICDRANCIEEHTRTKVGSALEHKWSDWSSNGNNTHTRTCLYNHTQTENCLGGMATCTELAICKNCNEKYGKLEKHTYLDKYSYTSTHHWLDATCGCDLQKDYAEHILVDDQNCSICAAPVTDTAGIFYDTSSDGTYAEVIGYEGTAKKVIIADTYKNLPVKTIYDGAFKDTNIISVIIPDSVTSIGDDAFYRCYSLQSVTIGNSVTSIGDAAFFHCYSLKSVSLSQKLIYIKGQAFDSCFSLRSIIIPNSVTTIGSMAFINCGLVSVIIGESVTSIGDWAFNGCTSLISVTIGDKVEHIGYWAFDNCRYNISENINYLGDKINPYKILVGATNKNMSTYVIHEQTKYIYHEAFSGCERLTDIDVPNNITYIGNNAFSNCNLLANIVLPNNVAYIGASAFSGCSLLTSINISCKVTVIASFAFSGCSSLAKINIPDSVTIIGSYAFKGCSRLQSIVIPDSVTIINEDAFSGCGSLTIYCETTAKPDGWSSSWNDSINHVVWGYKGE